MNCLTEPFPRALLFPECTFSPARDLSLLWEEILKTFRKEGSYTAQETTCGYQFSQDEAREKTQSSDQQSSMSGYWGPLPVRLLPFTQKALTLKELAEKKMYLCQLLFLESSHLDTFIIAEPLTFLNDFRQAKCYPISKDMMFQGAWLMPGPVLGFKWEEFSCKTCIVWEPYLGQEEARVGENNLEGKHNGLT